MARRRLTRVLVLDYDYGEGDKVTTSVEETGTAVVVSLDRESPGGDRTAIGLHGRQEFLLRGDLHGRPVRSEDGQVLPCPASRRL